MIDKHHEDLSHIRSMMERSSRFISLSGLSGVFAGLTALVGGGCIYFVFQDRGIDYFDGQTTLYAQDFVFELVCVGLAILAGALFFGIFFTIRKSKKYGLPVWTSSTKKMLFNLAVPLAVGGVFCMALLMYKMYVFIAPVTLLFYGLGLINAEKYTLTDIKYLGFCELILGCIALFYLGYGLFFWILGFGILHVVYGLVVYKKYK